MRLPATSWVGRLADAIEDEVHRLAQLANQDTEIKTELVKNGKMIKLVEIRAAIITDFKQEKTLQDWLSELASIGFEPYIKP